MAPLFLISSHSKKAVGLTLRAFLLHFKQFEQVGKWFSQSGDNVSSFSHWKKPIECGLRYTETGETHLWDASSEKTNKQKTSHLPSPCMFASLLTCETFLDFLSVPLSPSVTLSFPPSWFNTLCSGHRSQKNLPRWHMIKAYCSMKEWKRVTRPGKEQ